MFAIKYLYRNEWLFLPTTYDTVDGAAWAQQICEYECGALTVVVRAER